MNSSMNILMTGLLLINLGTPDAPTTPAVRHYLRQFLSDPRVIDIPALWRWLLVNFMIVPFRSPKSAKAYQKIWTPDGSPLLIYTQNLAREVFKKLGGDYAVAVGMRYGSPSIETALRELKKKGVSEIRVLPLFPQYASSSTGSAIEETFRVAREIPTLPPLTILPSFYSHPFFIRSFVEVGRPILEKIKPDHVLFSFHGLPERQIRKEDKSGDHCLTSETCCDTISDKNVFCYRAHCYHTARHIAQGLNLAGEDYSVSFQSRLGRTPWIQPFTDIRLVELAKAGKKRIAVFCPSFVADCLETLEEIGIRARESVLSYGTELELVPSLNTHPRWVDSVCEMAKNPPTVTVCC